MNGTRPGSGREAVVIEATNRLRESAEFELHALVEKRPEMFESVVAKQILQLEAETAGLKAEAAELAKEIETLIGQPAPGGWAGARAIFSENQKRRPARGRTAFVDCFAVCSAKGYFVGTVAMVCRTRPAIL
jgi:hypothetical protein